jgi:hypothetical protein
VLSRPGLRHSREALVLAEALSRPAFLASALVSTGVLHMFLRDAAKAMELAEGVIAIATEQGFQFDLANATSERGWALLRQDRVAEAMSEMRPVPAMRLSRRGTPRIPPAHRPTAFIISSE